MLMATLILLVAATNIPPPAPPPEPPPTASGSWPVATVSAARAACATLLAGRNLDWTQLAPIGSADSCGAPAPVLLRKVSGVTITPAAILSCPMTAALDHWVTRTLQPLAMHSLGTRVTAIRNASAYVCRSRNNIVGAKLSEHARANALDIAAFDFAGKPPPGWPGGLGADGRPVPGSFLARVQRGACASFTTVLGPGSDAYHGDHFHLDLAIRKNDYRLCQ